MTALRREAEKFALGNILNWRKSNEISLSLIRRVFASDKSNRPAVASGVSQTPTQKFVDETEDECGGWKLGKDQVQTCNLDTLLKVEVDGKWRSSHFLVKEHKVQVDPPELDICLQIDR